ncbi:hypothetical protein THASP1DRAFT_27964 [Thamnocephalis sphaerospora]|uniref:Uncharacterized protein n=1 Tax=Thamnocephalis sphaerospora TaxID=78915 RepID=A0A4P9XVE9_9FUNG|nr:hypothetical protein THASP1DRAFT_27964 [Thamnocephalis sphaerospora]|eukprot:RKP10236.1 hypothetical protein THASP1DRAFT_27964 [Thamnocephalis sphaerospora]
MPRSAAANVQLIDVDRLCGLMLREQLLFIVSRDRLLSRLEQCISEAFGDTLLITADAERGRPSMLESTERDAFVTQLVKVATKVQSALSAPGVHGGVLDCSSFVDDATVVAFTGWLLEYPVVYVHPRPTESNCLGLEELLLVRAHAVCTHERHNELTEESMYLLQSFSLPTSAVDSQHTDVLVKAWQARWGLRFARQQVWSNLRTTVQHVTLSYVVL